MKYARSVEAFFAAPTPFAEQLARLRQIVRACGLDESLKWGRPVYTQNGTLVVGLAAFKAHAAIWFFQGALLKDPAGVLVNAQPGKTVAMRHWRFRAGDRLPAARIRAYVLEARRLAEAGRAIPPRRNRPWTMPAELAAELRKEPRAAAAFAALSPSCQREHAEYVAEARRPQTREARARKTTERLRADFAQIKRVEGR